MIYLKNISFSYSIPLSKNKIEVFRNLSISFEKGKIHTITAPNGYGKTTLLKIISGFLIPSTGSLYIENSQINFKDFPYEKISLFYNQERAFYHQLTVIENLNFYGFYDIKKTKERLTYVNLDIKNLYKKFGMLSSGNKSKSLILKIFLENRQVILLDEPFSYIDSYSKKSIKEHLIKIKEGKYLIIATNNTDETKDISDILVDIKK